MRLQRYLARAGVASRRKCDEVIIPSGRVQVNGEVVKSPGFKVDSLKDEVLLDGQKVKLSQESATLMLNKPKGFESTMSSKHADKIISELVPIEQYPGLVNVGRLDKDTTGLLLFTTDGDLCHSLLHPARKVNKTYIARVSGKLSEEERRHLEDGVVIDDGPTAPAVCKIIEYDSGTDSTLAEITIHEGRNRQVRKMFSAVGHEVIDLHRAKFGPLELGNLQPGEWRLLDEGEVDSLVLASKLQ